DHDDYVGRIAIGRIQAGSLRTGQSVLYSKPEATPKSGRVQALYAFERLERVRTEAAGAGEIVAISGIADLEVGETVTQPERPAFLPPLRVDEPTLSVVFRVNDSPLAGRSGEFLTSRHLRD